jgi:two-component system OmpR family response regulator
MSTETTPRTRLTRPDGSPLRLLVVDDEPNLAELLTAALRYEGWDVSTALNGQQAIKLAREITPDVVVLDIMLPDVDGLQVLRRVRETQPNVPVLFLTARDSVEDRVAGLTAGGDDYVTKPFSLEEVVARLRGLLRRAGAQSGHADATLTVGDLTLDEDSHEVTRAGVDIHLTATEFELLRYPCATPAASCPRRRSSTACGTTTSAARRTSSSSTSPTCAARSTRGASR